MASDQPAFWSISADGQLKKLNASVNGLEEPEAERRLKVYGPNSLRKEKESSALRMLLSQFKTPIILLLLFSAILSFYLSQGIQALIIVIILLISGVLGFWQEYTATDAVSRLLELVQIKAAVLREGDRFEIPVEDIVPEDIILLRAGDIIPGDALILDSKDLFVNEATLTGETYPVEKHGGAENEDAPLHGRINRLFMGTSVVSGTAKAIVVSAGLQTLLPPSGSGPYSSASGGNHQHQLGAWSEEDG